MATPPATHASKKFAVEPTESELVPFEHGAAGQYGTFHEARSLQLMN